MNKENENYLLGQELFNKGLRYTQIPNHIDGGVHADIYKGFDAEARVSRCGFLSRDWNLNFSYKPSYDLRPWFT